MNQQTLGEQHTCIINMCDHHVMYHVAHVLHMHHFRIDATMMRNADGAGCACHDHDIYPLCTSPVPVPACVSDRIDNSLDHLIPLDTNLPYDMHEVVRRVVDEDRFFEIMPTYAKNILIGFARLDGKTVGIVANQVRRTTQSRMDERMDVR